MPGRISLANTVAQAGQELKAAGLLKPQDHPMLLLACQYAASIDAADPLFRAAVLKELGPRLAEALAALGMSPAGRAKLTGKADAPAAPQPAASVRDELRRRRAERAERAAGEA